MEFSTLFTAVPVGPWIYYILFFYFECGLSLVYLVIYFPYYVLSFSERRHEKKIDGGETNSSKSSPISDNNDRKKEKFSIGDDKDDHEKKV